MFNVDFFKVMKKMTFDVLFSLNRNSHHRRISNRQKLISYRLFYFLLFFLCFGFPNFTSLLSLRPLFLLSFSPFCKVSLLLLRENSPLCSQRFLSPLLCAKWRTQQERPREKWRRFVSRICAAPLSVLLYEGR